jgi:hypothetical protein
MALSDTAVWPAKATGKASTLSDTDGLSLARSRKGSKSWHFRCCWHIRPIANILAFFKIYR